jgi:hypothetical protein
MEKNPSQRLFNFYQKPAFVIVLIILFSSLVMYSHASDPDGPKEKSSQFAVEEYQEGGTDFIHIRVESGEVKRFTVRIYSPHEKVLVNDEYVGPGVKLEKLDSYAVVRVTYLSDDGKLKDYSKGLHFKEK